MKPQLILSVFVALIGYAIMPSDKSDEPKQSVAEVTEIENPFEAVDLPMFVSQLDGYGTPASEPTSSYDVCDCDCDANTEAIKRLASRVTKLEAEHSDLKAKFTPAMASYNSTGSGSSGSTYSSYQTASVGNGSTGGAVQSYAPVVSREIRTPVRSAVQTIVQPQYQVQYQPTVSSGTCYIDPVSGQQICPTANTSNSYQPLRRGLLGWRRR